MPRVTVITPVYNSAKYLPETLASIRAQTYSDYEYILADDASTDTTCAVVSRATETDSRVRLLKRKVNGGPFAAANDALRAASGEIIVCTDADDISLPERIERQVAFLDAHPELEACFTLARALDDDRPVRRVPLTSGSLRWGLCLGCILVHSSMCIRREAFARRGYYRDLPLAQDYRLFCDLARDGVVAVLPELQLMFRRAPTRVSSVRLNELLRHTLDVIQDHTYALSSQGWSTGELSSLIAVMRMQRHSVPAAMRALRRWAGEWTADDSLSGAERWELTNLAAEKTRAFLLRNLTVSPRGVLRRLTSVATV